MMTGVTLHSYTRFKDILHGFVSPELEVAALARLGRLAAQGDGGEHLPTSVRGYELECL